MNVTKAKASDVVSDVQDESFSQQTSTIANDACTALMDEATKTITTADNQQHFTADHIMQLCLFLAEKSRAKQLQQTQEMNARRYYENFLKEANDLGEDEKMLKNNDCNIPQTQTHTDNYNLKSPTMKHNSAKPPQTSPRIIRQTKLKSEKILKQSILTDKLSTSANYNININCNSLTETYEKFNQSTENHHQQQQDKRDILLKIRQQIFERKRLRQMLNGGQRRNGQYQLQKQHRLDYDPAPMQQQDELQQLTEVWRPW